MPIDAFYIEYLIRAHMNSATECYDLRVEIIKRYEMREWERERERERCAQCLIKSLLKNKSNEGAYIWKEIVNL